MTGATSSYRALINMTKVLLLACLWLALAWLGAGCGGDHHDEKAWTQADLDELERKWGFEVSLISLITDVHPKTLPSLMTPALGPG